MGKIISHNSLDKTKHLTIYGIIYGLKRILRIRSVCTRFWKYLLINSNVEMKISSTIAHNTALNDLFMIAYGLKRILRIRSVCTRFWKYLLINSNVEMKISSTIAHNTALNDLFMIASNNDVKITLSNIVEKQQL